ncbi:MAG: hypothetical protein GEU90_18835 [Gemmatimonas sp.]|nr:hypothetical protein [Gemmatimonas sp.]
MRKDLDAALGRNLFREAASSPLLRSPLLARDDMDATTDTIRSAEAEGNHDDHDLQSVLNVAIFALERLLNLFRIERYLHLVLGFLSFLLLLYVGVALVRAGTLNDSSLTLLFGASGLFTAASFRTTYYFNKGFKLIDDIIRTLLGVRNTDG